jgi:hypothetical protein
MLPIALTLLLIAAPSFAQVTITTADLQYDIGQSYSMYNIPSPHGVIGMTGLQGGPHVFDFSSGNTSVEWTFDYVDVTDGGHQADFPSATIAEKRVSAEGSAWMYMDFQAGIGRVNYGFYDEVGLPESPSVPFNPSIVDFPTHISYQSFFSGATNFDVTSSGVTMNIDYEYTGFVDGYGTVVLPDSLDELNCIQVNYEEKYTYYWMGVPIQYSYLRSYYYIAEDVGIVAIITSREEDAPVPNNFNIANTIARLFESSKLNTDTAVDDALVTDMLGGNYPNPFTPQTRIRYHLPSAEVVRLGVYDIAGRLVKTLVDGPTAAGSHEVIWSGANRSGHPAPAGVYFYRIDAGDASQSRKMTLVR